MATKPFARCITLSTDGSDGTFIRKAKNAGMFALGVLEFSKKVARGLAQPVPAWREILHLRE